MSSPEQLKGDSVRRQQTATDRYVAEAGLTLTDIISDHGVSAFRGKNSEFGALAQFLHLAERGEIEEGSYLIVESLDRLTRQNVFDAIALLSRIIDYGINVVTLIDRRVYSKESLATSQSDLLIAAITMMRGHEESLMKSVRLAAAWSNKREKARNGKLTRHKLPTWLKFTDDGTAIIAVAHRAAIIREIFELSRDGWGTYSIARLLNERGEVTWGSAAFWGDSFVKKLLGNRAVLGEYQPQRLVTQGHRKIRIPDGDPIKGYYPAVIDELLFDDASKAAARRRVAGRGRKGKSHTNIFSGLLKCDACQSGMRFIDKGQPPKGGQYLRCGMSLSGGKCRAPGIRYHSAEELLLNVIRNVNVRTLVNGDEWEQEARDARQKRLNLEKEVVAHTDQIGRIVSAIANVPDSGELQIKLRELTASRQSLLDEIEGVDAALADLGEGHDIPVQALLLRLNGGSLNDLEVVKNRKKLSAELQRVIRSIHLAVEIEEPWEAKDDAVTERRSGLRGRIFYRSGAWQTFDSLNGQDVYAIDGTQQTLMRRRYAIDQLE
ncbi:recombinase family protein [Rhizorhabdus dicambivorans]|uniref:Recombinase family protein n=2 Tax=Rhizorhabdus dicambivorans TaxID=1850238 RepID=A0A2A4FS22_9SPHN|nr:recombinase family protein [Rhizorhabdus dicambivorans]PCE40201.1 recombinase family protein [Rhizorhabdus dicambivorans]